MSKLISSLSLSYSSQRLIDSMLKRKVAIGRSPFSRDKIIGWLGEEEREAAMIGFLKVETRHRHFSFDQMIARSGDRERQGEFLRRVTSSADRASEPRNGGSTDPLSSLLRLAPIHAHASRSCLRSYSMLTLSLMLCFSAAVTSISETLLTPPLGDYGKV